MGWRTDRIGPSAIDWISTGWRSQGGFSMSKVRHGHTTRELGPAPQGAKSAPSAPTAAEFLRHAATGTAVQRALAGGQPPRPAELTAMQRALGNRAVGAM